MHDGASSAGYEVGYTSHSLLTFVDEGHTARVRSVAPRRVVGEYMVSYVIVDDLSPFAGRN